MKVRKLTLTFSISVFLLGRFKHGTFFMMMTFGTLFHPHPDLCLARYSFCDCSSIAMLAIMPVASQRPLKARIVAILDSSFINILAGRLVFEVLVPGMLFMIWNLIHVWLCCAFAWPIHLGTLQTRAAVAFSVQDASRAMPFLELGVYEILVPEMFLLAWYLIRVRASTMPFLELGTRIMGYFPEQCSCCLFVASVFLFDLLDVLIYSPRLGSGWMLVV